jgi:hypothetical protein
VERQDVRMFETGGELDLAQEPLAADRGGQLGPEDLIATGRSSFKSSAKYTIAIPPRPSSPSIR